MARTPEATRAREAAIAAREAARVGNAQALADFQAAEARAIEIEARAREAAAAGCRVVDMSSAFVGPVQGDPSTDPSVERFRRLQID